MFCSKCDVENSNEAKFCKNCGNALGEQQPVYTPTSEVILPASMLQRFLNNLIDGFVMYIFGAIAVQIGMDVLGEGLGLIVGIVCFFGYHLIFEALFQRTVGKMLTGTKVVSVDGGKASFRALLGRTLARYIPFEPLSFLFYGSYPTKGWHDRLSGTLVVPKDLTPKQVRAIDSEKIRATKNDSNSTIVLIIIIGGFLLMATIGIISSVVLASLNTARDRGEDAAIKSSMNNIRVQAELYYADNLNSYDNFCFERQTTLLLNQIFGDKSVDYTCNDSSFGYAISAPLNEGGHYCVDNSGNAGVVIDEPLNSQTSCSDASASNYENNTLSTKTVYQELKETEEYINSLLNLPAMVDEETRLDRVYVSHDNKMNYDYTMVNFSSDELEWSFMEEIIMEEIIEPELKLSFCYDSIFEYYREKNVPMKWHYYDKNGAFIGAIELSNKDC